jgi:hypothetical protein
MKTRKKGRQEQSSAEWILMDRAVRRGGWERLWSRWSELKCSSRRINMPMDSCTENDAEIDRCILDVY